MIRVSVHAVSGHYRVPGAVEVGGLARSFPVAPPSTVRGFVESLCGLAPGRSEGTRIAYGQLSPPVGQGAVLRLDHVWSSSGAKGKTKGAKGEATRPVRHETWVGVAYQVAIDGPVEPLVHQALAGEVSRYGVLSLGESDDQVWWIAAEVRPARWVVPGQEMALIEVADRGYDRISPVWGQFALSRPAQHVPDDAWLPA